MAERTTSEETGERRRLALRIALKVVPGARSDEITGWLGDSLKVRVRAPAESGRANAAVLRVLAQALSLSEDAIRIVSGHGSPRKTLELDGIDLETLRARLAEP